MIGPAAKKATIIAAATRTTRSTVQPFLAKMKYEPTDSTANTMMTAKSSNRSTRIVATP